VFRTLLKDANARGLDGLRIKLTEHVQEDDVEDISRSILSLEHSRIRAGVELLGGLNIKRNTADRRRDRNSELRNASDHRRDEVDGWFIGRPEVNLYRLKTAVTIGNGDVNAHGVNEFEIMRGLYTKGEVVEAECGRVFERQESIATATW
jgi:hypothetical protein